jgi:hypothetical protein
MHVGEIETDVALVRRLLAGQFPNWKDKSIEFIPSFGTDHDIYRLGEAFGRAVTSHRLGQAPSCKRSVLAPQTGACIATVHPSADRGRSCHDSCSNRENRSISGLGQLDLKSSTLRAVHLDGSRWQHPGRAEGGNRVRRNCFFYGSDGQVTWKGPMGLHIVR